MNEVDGLVVHLVDCTKPDAVLVVNHRDGDVVVEALLADGWTLDRMESVAGKRIRYLKPPVIV